MSQKRKIEDISSEEPLSLQDVIAEDEEMEETADAVLGASDDQECTYGKGYVKRQAVYACATCTISQDSLAGVCLACSLECHNGHDLYELYTKRNFCCDCGNDKFPQMKCKLLPEKDATNDKNSYNQNFNGLYCQCSRPYPDVEDDTDDEMIQCVLCEDWFHGRHLGESSVPSGSAFSEMVCFDCTKKCTFLHKYSAILIAPVKLEKDMENSEINVTDVTVNPVKSNELLEEDVKKTVEKDGPIGDTIKEDASSSSGSSECKIIGAIPVKINGATFWPTGWRSVLCKCQNCLKVYSELNVSFVLDEEDTVRAYEDEGKKRALEKKQSHEASALRGMSRMHQVEMLHGYNDMKEGLSQYLRKFAEEGKVVTAADIQKFFSGLNNKRQRVQMPYNCR